MIRCSSTLKLHDALVVAIPRTLRNGAFPFVLLTFIQSSGSLLSLTFVIADVLEAATSYADLVALDKTADAVVCGDSTTNGGVRVLIEYSRFEWSE